VGEADVFARLAALGGATSGDGTTDTDLAQRVETLESQLTGALTRMDALEGDLADSNGRIDALETDLAGSDNRIATLEEQLVDAESRIDTLEEAVNTLLAEHNLTLLDALSVE
jgi:chromosome segregation ATPase